MRRPARGVRRRKRSPRMCSRMSAFRSFRRDCICARFIIILYDLFTFNETPVTKPQILRTWNKCTVTPPRARARHASTPLTNRAASLACRAGQAARARANPRHAVAYIHTTSTPTGVELPAGAAPGGGHPGNTTELAPHKPQSSVRKSHCDRYNTGRRPSWRATSLPLPLNC